MAADGQLIIAVDGRTVAEGRAPKPLVEVPGDLLQVGADRIKPVGEYEVPAPFTGTLSRVRINPKE